MKTPAALFDLNVVIDVLVNRAPYADDSAAALALVDAGAIHGYVAAHSVTTLHYLLERDLGRPRARKAIARLLDLLRVAAVDEDRLRESVAMGWRDFEDAVQASCAEAVGADYLVTRDKRGFKRATTRVISPAELVVLADPPPPRTTRSSSP